MDRNVYQMTISRLTVDKLGVKLYDKVSAVIAELIANSYDADATQVVVTCPMEEYLATKTKDGIQDKGYVIEVEDNGIGMTPTEVNEFYLVVGKERRVDAKRGDRSKVFGRKVLGRKGVGKLAPFGVCQRMEIITSGGEEQVRKTAQKKEKGFLTAHIILEKSKIITDTDSPYEPAIGELDNSLRPSRGTLIRLSQFDYRRVPSMVDFERALAQRFGLPSANWTMKLRDLLKTEDDPSGAKIVAQFDVGETIEEAQINFARRDGEDGSDDPKHYAVEDCKGKTIEDLTPGFQYEDRFYPVTGWIGYSRKPYNDDLMAGIRIYCRGKIAAQTHIFNLKAGFTGEYDVRSYLVGALSADWLDEGEDLIRTDRQDILWSHELGQAFETWGQKVVKKIGEMTRGPKKQRAWELFEKTSNIQEQVKEAFPGEERREIRENTLEIARVIAQSSKDEELQDPSFRQGLLDLSMTMGPHVTLDRSLRKAAEDKGDPLSVIVKILRTARIAELAGFGKIAEDRVKVIEKVGELKDKEHTLESAFQELISSAPWLINPAWQPITANQSFATLKVEFQKYYEKQTGKELVLDAFTDPNKRSDFVLSNQETAIEIIEIKKPGHSLQNEEMGRIDTYVRLMREFLDLPGNGEFKVLFPRFHVTLVCDGLALSGVYGTALEGLVREGTLFHQTWNAFLLKARKAHEDFLNENERQKKIAVTD